MDDFVDVPVAYAPYLIPVARMRRVANQIKIRFESYLSGMAACCKL
jgi:hypothetical protein